MPTHSENALAERDEGYARLFSDDQIALYEQLAELAEQRDPQVDAAPPQSAAWGPYYRGFFF